MNLPTIFNSHEHHCLQYKQNFAIKYNYFYSPTATALVIIPVHSIIWIVSLRLL